MSKWHGEILLNIELEMQRKIKVVVKYGLCQDRPITMIKYSSYSKEDMVCKEYYKNNHHLCSEDGQ